MRYKVFGRHTGLRVSELVLGAANFGTRWGHGAEPAEARRVFERYSEAGGNFIDTADTYQAGESEELLGDLLQGRRENFVLATKYTLGANPNGGILVTGNSRKAMTASVEASLKRLKTDHIDLYWVHYSDGVTPVEEIVRGFDDLVRAGKILYGGLSDFPAWRVARAATIAELRGLAPIAGLQVEHSLVERTTEQDLLPMAQALGIGTVAWSPLGGGMLTGKYRRGEAPPEGTRLAAWGARGAQALNDRNFDKVEKLEAWAQARGHTVLELAFAWLLGHPAVSSVIAGATSPKQVRTNATTADRRLTPEEVDEVGKLVA
jgi:aryl-alcohol dehydrogenase-like predicted oxidoreductase